MADNNRLHDSWGQILEPTAADTEVETWEKNLREACKVQEGLPRLIEQYQVLNVKRLKKKAHPQHEYIVATVHSPRMRVVHYRMERSVRRKERRSADGAGVDRGSRDSLDSFRKSSGASSIFSGKPSHDTVHIISKIPADHCLSEVTFKDEPKPNILDLSVLAAVIHLDSPTYNIFRRQCYWFAGMMSKVMAYRYGGKIDEVEPDSETCEHCMAAVQDAEAEAGEGSNKHTNLSSGAFQGVLISKILKMDVEAMTTKFNARRAEAVDEVSLHFQSEKK
jgi:hypothetical protein